MDILVNGSPVCLKDSFSFEYVEENRLFSGSDGYSLTITFPLRGCPQNLAIFGNINREDVVADKAVFDCSIRDRSFVKHGTITVTEIDDSEVKTQFLEGRSEANFKSAFDEIYINDLDLGHPKFFSPSDISPSDAWNNGVAALDFVALPWVNNESGNIQNCPKYSDGAYIWHSDTKGLSWQPYLLYIAKKICEALHYSYDFYDWEDNEDHRYLLVCNTLPWAWNMPNFAAALPHWTVTEFFSKLEAFLDAEFDIDHRAEHIDFAYTQVRLAQAAPVNIRKVLAEHSVAVSVENENCDYREAKNLAYAECDHEMWKYYSCDWFLKPRKHNAVVYDTLSELLSDNKWLATWNSQGGRGTNRNSVLYAKDIDAYFVVRAVQKTLLKENADLPNRYSYKCILQPINLFGARIVDDSDDAEQNELEFVPAWIDYTDPTYGNCLYLSFSGYDDMDTASAEINVGGHGESAEEYKERIDGTFYQPFTVQALEAGEKNKCDEFYDKIYVGWWDGTADFVNGKLPYPYVDDVVINEDWSGYFRPHSSLRLNDKAANAARKVYAVDTKRKYTFKFLSDTLPNPRALFFIRGKRYVCEKLTASFSEKGMSQLVKGEFWLVKDD